MTTHGTPLTPEEERELRRWIATGSSPTVATETVARILATLDRERRMADTEVAALRDGLDKAIEAATRRETELRARIEALREFAEAHHGDEQPHVWLHALTIDIPARLDALFATDAGTECVSCWEGEHDIDYHEHHTHGDRGDPYIGPPHALDTDAGTEERDPTVAAVERVIADGARAAVSTIAEDDLDPDVLAWIDEHASPSEDRDAEIERIAAAIPDRWRKADGTVRVEGSPRFVAEVVHDAGFRATRPR